VSDAPHCKLLLSSEEGGSITVFRGDCVAETITLEPGRVRQVGMAVPEAYGHVTASAFDRWRFSPTVWRVYCNAHTLIYHGIDDYGYGHRPPGPDEKPARRWLAYGSSITMGGQQFENYVNMAAATLGVDAFNLGMAGSCHIEKEVADYIAFRDDWDFATLELGVNMLGGFEPEEFERRSTYLVDRLVERHPSRPVALITIITSKLQHAAEQSMWTDRAAAYDAILAKLQSTKSKGNLHLIDGAGLGRDLVGFKTDLVHPTARAHVLIGEKLAHELGRVVGD
jgi:lysophospholipase L1-like esterase